MTQPAHVAEYLDRVAREAWAVVNPDKQLAISARLAVYQSRTGDVAGLPDTAVRVRAILPKATTPLREVMAHATLAVVAGRLSDGKGHAAHLAAADDALARCALADRDTALPHLITAYLVGGRYEDAMERARMLYAGGASNLPTIVRLFRNAGAGPRLSPLLVSWAGDAVRESDRVRFVSHLIAVAARAEAEALARSLTAAGLRGRALTACAVARYRSRESVAYAALVTEVAGTAEQGPASVRGLAYASLAAAQARAGDRAGAIGMVRVALAAPRGFDPVFTLLEIARAQSIAADPALSVTVAEFEAALAKESPTARADARLQLAALHADADRLDLALAALATADAPSTRPATQPFSPFRLDALCAVAAAQVRAGRSAHALATARALDDPSLRHPVYESIAVAHAARGDLDAAWDALTQIRLEPQLRARTFPRLLRAAARAATPEVIDKYATLPPASADRAALYLTVVEALLDDDGER